MQRLRKILNPIEKLEFAAQSNFCTLIRRTSREEVDMWDMQLIKNPRRKFIVHAIRDKDKTVIKFSFLPVGLVSQYDGKIFGTNIAIYVSATKSAMVIANDINRRLIVGKEFEFKAWEEALRRHESLILQKNDFMANIMVELEASIKVDNTIYSKTSNLKITVNDDCTGTIQFNFQNPDICFKFINTFKN